MSSELEHRAQRLVEPLDDRPRHPGRRRHAVILHRLETGQPGFRRRRHVRQRRRTGGSGHRKAAQLSGFDLAHGRRNGVEAERDVIAEEIVGQRTGAFIGDRRDVDAAQQIEQFCGEVIERRRRRRAGGKLAGLLFRQRDDVGKRLHRQRRIGVDDDRRRGDDADRRKILVDIVAGIGAETDAGQHHADGVAVGLRLGEVARADHAAGAGPIFDDDLLAERS